MPRKPRLFVPDATYHVYCRIARGEFVFDESCEADRFVETVRQVGGLHRWRVLAWCLMGNHYHLVVRTSSIPLWRTMQRLQSNVAREFNRRRKYLGRLWQSRYRARLIDSQDYFRQVVSYVHLNPVAAAIVDDPADYAYSGHREIIGRCPCRLVDVPSVLVGFHDGIASDAQEDYLTWVRAVAEAKWLDRGLRELPWWKDARDLNEIVEPEDHPEATMFEGGTLDDNRPTISIDDFVVLFEEATGRSMACLSSPLRTSDLTDGRVEITMLAVTRFGLRSTELAGLLRKHQSSLTRWLNLGLEKEREDMPFRDRINQLDYEISTAARECRPTKR
jgi:REP element-mobilizing transposase RayT